MHITRLVKREAGDPTFERIADEAEVVKLAGRRAPLDVVAEYGVDASRDAALDTATRLALGAGFDALRDAGIPLVMRYKTTTLGSSLPERWGLPDALRDDTGVVFASAFPGYDSFAEDLNRLLRPTGAVASSCSPSRLVAVTDGRERAGGVRGGPARSPSCGTCSTTEPFTFDRRFLFRCLSMGHSQFAEIIGARGPNTQVNAACASTTQALSLAEDWIRAGRCRRVVVVSADDVTSDTLLPWVAAGFLATGAAATDDVVEDAATPFDRRRHGMIVGMGGARPSSSSPRDAARERGLRPICEVLGTVTANSAFHGTRLDVEHIAQVMESVVRAGGAAGRRPPRDRRLHGLRLARDVHARPGWKRGRRDQRAAPGVRRRRRRRRHREHEGLHGPRHGCGHRGRRRRQGPGDRDRAAGAQLQGARPGPGRARTCPRVGPTRWSMRYGSPPASAPRSP